MAAHSSKKALAGTSLHHLMERSGIDPLCQTHHLTARDIAKLMLDVHGAEKVRLMTSTEFVRQMHEMEKRVSRALRLDLATLVAL